MCILLQNSHIKIQHSHNIFISLMLFLARNQQCQSTVGNGMLICWFINTGLKHQRCGYQSTLLLLVHSAGCKPEPAVNCKNCTSVVCQKFTNKTADSRCFISFNHVQKTMSVDLTRGDEAKEIVAVCMWRLQIHLKLSSELRNSHRDSSNADIGLNNNTCNNNICRPNVWSPQYPHYTQELISSSIV